MKTIFQRISAMLALFLTFSIGLAQETKKVEVGINVDKGGGGYWYTQPWVWIVGGAVFILLLVALMRSGGNKKT